MEKTKNLKHAVDKLKKLFKANEKILQYHYCLGVLHRVTTFESYGSSSEISHSCHVKSIN